MAQAFKTGKPRKGQWVWVQKGDKKFVGICVDSDHGHFTTALDPLSGEIVVRQFPPQGAILDFKGKPDVFCVTIVDETGFSDVGTFLIHLDRLAPVTRREDIPAPRLATMRPDWAPLP